MLAEALIALAAAGGTAVVQAAGTDAWQGLRDRLASWFGRGDSERESRELERLDRSAAELVATDESTAVQVRTRQESAWQARIESVLEDLDDEQRDQAALLLQKLLEEAAVPEPGVNGGLVSGNTFSGPTAFMAGNHNKQDVKFGRDV